MLWRARPGFIALPRAALDTTPPPPSWTTAFSQSLSADNSGWSGFNMRQVLNSTLLSASGSLVRLTLQAANAAGCSIDGIYIGHAAASGDAYDFDGGQVQLKVSGSGSFSISAGASVVTDAATFALDQSKNLVIAAHFNATSSIRSVSASNATNYFKSAANETSTSDVSGYTSAIVTVRLINKIEVQ